MTNRRAVASSFPGAFHEFDDDPPDQSDAPHPNWYPAPNCFCDQCANLLKAGGHYMYGHSLPPGGSGPFTITAKQPFLVYTISGLYAFEEENVAIAFAARLISRGDELKIVVAKVQPIKSLSSKVDPDVAIEDISSQAAITDGGGT